MQAPLQPLQDNLESSTYETFERDTIKYTTYQEAVYRALLDRTPPLGKEAETVVLMVVGAGRGPLVRASLLVRAPLSPLCLLRNSCKLCRLFL